MGCRLPEEFRAAEAEFRQAIAAAVRRGKVECSLYFRPALAAGARGYVLKSDAGRDLVNAVEALVQHRTFFSSKISEMLLNSY